MVVSAEITRLIADCRTHLPGSITSAIQAEFFAAAREFFDFTNVWTEEIDIPIVADMRSYTLAAPALGRISRLMVLFNSEDIDKRWVCPASMAVPGVVILGKTPNAAATWVALVAKTCADPVTSEGYPDIPDWIMSKYWSTFFVGTIGRMHAQSNKPYSDPKKALFRKQQFLQGKSQARVEAVKTNVYAQTAWGFPAGFSSGSQKGA